jgi:hypothetical protein
MLVVRSWQFTSRKVRGPFPSHSFTSIFTVVTGFRSRLWSCAPDVLGCVCVPLKLNWSYILVLAGVICGRSVLTGIIWECYKLFGKSKRSQSVEMVLASLINRHPLWSAPTFFLFFFSETPMVVLVIGSIFMVRSKLWSYKLYDIEL